MTMTLHNHNTTHKIMNILSIFCMFANATGRSGTASIHLFYHLTAFSTTATALSSSTLMINQLFTASPKGGAYQNTFTRGQPHFGLGDGGYLDSLSNNNSNDNNDSNQGDEEAKSNWSMKQDSTQGEISNLNLEENDHNDTITDDAIMSQSSYFSMEANAVSSRDEGEQYLSVESQQTKQDKEVKFDESSLDNYLKRINNQKQQLEEIQSKLEQSTSRKDAMNDEINSSDDYDSDKTTSMPDMNELDVVADLNNDEGNNNVEEFVHASIYGDADSNLFDLESVEDEIDILLQKLNNFQSNDVFDDTSCEELSEQSDFKSQVPVVHTSVYGDAESNSHKIDNVEDEIDNVEDEVDNAEDEVDNVEDEIDLKVQQLDNLQLLDDDVVDGTSYDELSKQSDFEAQVTVAKTRVQGALQKAMLIQKSDMLNDNETNEEKQVTDLASIAPEIEAVILEESEKFAKKKEAQAVVQEASNPNEDEDDEDEDDEDARVRKTLDFERQIYRGVAKAKTNKVIARVEELKELDQDVLSEEDKVQSEEGKNVITLIPTKKKVFNTTMKQNEAIEQKVGDVTISRELDEKVTEVLPTVANAASNKSEQRGANFSFFAKSGDGEDNTNVADSFSFKNPKMEGPKDPSAKASDVLVDTKEDNEASTDEDTSLSVQATDDSPEPEMKPDDDKDEFPTLSKNPSEEVETSDKNDSATQADPLTSILGSLFGNPGSDYGSSSISQKSKPDVKERTSSLKNIDDKQSTFDVKTNDRQEEATPETNLFNIFGNDKATSKKSKKATLGQEMKVSKTENSKSKKVSENAGVMSIFGGTSSEDSEVDDAAEIILNNVISLTVWDLDYTKDGIILVGKTKESSKMGQILVSDEIITDPDFLIEGFSAISASGQTYKLGRRNKLVARKNEQIETNVANPFDIFGGSKATPKGNPRPTFSIPKPNPNKPSSPSKTKTSPTFSLSKTFQLKPKSSKESIVPKPPPSPPSKKKTSPTFSLSKTFQIQPKGSKESNVPKPSGKPQKVKSSPTFSLSKTFQMKPKPSKPAPAIPPKKPKMKSSPTFSLSQTFSLLGLDDKKQITPLSAFSDFPNDGIPVLTDWEINTNGSITGKIVNSESYKDGKKIETSAISKGVIRKGNIVTTRSGSKYRLM